MFLHENLGSPDRTIPFDLIYTHTKIMAADIHTKGYTSGDEWDRVSKLINVVHAADLNDRIREHHCFVFDCTIFPDVLPEHVKSSLDLLDIPPIKIENPENNVAASELIASSHEPDSTIAKARCVGKHLPDAPLHPAAGA